jgi:probable F420-dependent oxidoreductase
MRADIAPSDVRPRLVLGVANFAATPPTDWGHLVDIAREADDAGFDRLVVSDHVAFGPTLDDYARPESGGVAGGRQPTGPDGHWLEPLTALTWLAAHTSRVGLGTNILLAALRRPVVLAKTVATLDVLSGGRLDLGVGVGWQRAEYEAAGLDFSRRGRLLDHTLEVCTALWTGEAVDHTCDEASFSQVRACPPPRQPGGPPIWISGTLNSGVVARLARFGDGWIPWGPDAVDLRQAVPVMRTRVAEAGGRRPLRVFRYVALQPSPSEPATVDLDSTFAGVAEDVACGITDFRVPVDQIGTPLSIRGRFEEVVAAFGSQVD